MVTGVIFFAILMLYPIGKKAQHDSDEALAKVHIPIAPSIPAPPELEQAYELAIPGHARIRCPAPEGTEDSIGLRAQSTEHFGQSTLRWVDIRDGHLNAATTDSIGEAIVYSETGPLGIVRWSDPSLGAWTNCSMVSMEYVERDGMVLDPYGEPAPHINVSLCSNRATQSDAQGRFSVQVPISGSCTLRTFDILETELYLGQKRTIDSKIPKMNVPFKIALYGDLEHVSLEELKHLIAQRIRHLDEQESDGGEYAPIVAALRLTEAPESTRRILRQWADIERDHSVRIQLGELIREDVRLEDFRDALLFGALSDL
jgi:hypothetical protein